VTDGAIHDDLIESAIPLARAVMERNLVEDGFTAGQRYPRPWLRDTYEGGLFLPELGPDLFAAYARELETWAARQGGTPVYTWPGDHPHFVAGGERCAPGQISTNRSSGDHDETLMFIIAASELVSWARTGPIAGRTAEEWDALLAPAAETAWRWAYEQADDEWMLLDTRPLVAADWADQIGRRGICTNVQGLWFDATYGLISMAGGDRTRTVGLWDALETIEASIREALWRESAPMHLNAPAVAPFGHFVSWIGEDGAVVDYFELDSNFRLLAARIPTEEQADSVIDFVLDHPELLGDAAGPPGAKVVWGDYAPEHYASIHDNTGDGRYHNGWWGHVGALVAEGLHAYGRTDEAVAVLRTIAAALHRGAEDGTGLREWYDAAGTGHGSEWFQWSARAFLRAVGRVCK
jgi:hypothetical protein